VRAALEPLAATVKIRVHGDYHLGQVLKTRGGFVIIDFEGEPARPLAERRLRQAPLRDVAGMLRSLDYAAHAVGLEAPAGERAARLETLTAWEDRARRAFLAGYRAVASASAVPLAPASEPALLRACAAFELEKACYELRYELNNRPDWVVIPLAGIARILTAA
jgi:maltose alpha-D-glucosyltransferase/alpha-amylase